MSPLNDDELNSLLKQAKSKPPEPRPELTLRALRAYQQNVARRPHWRRLLLRPVPLPLPVGILAAVLLILTGAAGDRAFRRPSVVGQAPLVDGSTRDAGARCLSQLSGRPARIGPVNRQSYVQGVSTRARN
jgi:hypothetical protein